MVGVLDVLAVFLGSLHTLVVAIVLLGELTLNERDVRFLGVEFLKTCDSHVGVDVEVGVSILHIGLHIVVVVGEREFILSSGSTPFLLVGIGVALEDVTGGILGVPLACVVDALGDVLGILDGVSVVHSPCDLHLKCAVFLGEFACLIEEFLAVGSSLDCECTLSHIVEGIVGVSGNTLVEERLGCCCITLVQCYLTEIVECLGLVGRCCVEVALKQFLGIVKLANLVVLNSILVALCETRD